MCELHEQDLVNERLVITPDMAKKLAAETAGLRVRICGCRRDAGHCPPAEREVCLVFPGYPWDPGETRSMATAEALALVEKAEVRGDVFNLFHIQGTGIITELCLCCAACCFPMREVKEKGSHAEQPRLAYLVEREETECIGCGACALNCAFAAWHETGGGERELLAEKCFGCGRCVRLCPAGALHLGSVLGRERDAGWLGR